MKKYDPNVNNTHVNSILRRLNEDEDFKISYVEFSKNISPTLQGFEEKGCTTTKTKIEIPKVSETDDCLAQSKFIPLLEHEGVAFNLEKKKEILRNIEKAKKQ